MLEIGFDFALQVAQIAKCAGKEIMKIYATEFSVESKNDHSPVTAADKVSEEVILGALLNDIGSNFPLVSEEAASEALPPPVDQKPFWLIDPLDGTREFINRNGEFTVNIALIEEFSPLLGVVYIPAQNTTYFGFPAGAYRIQNDLPPENIRCRTSPEAGLTALVSRSHRTKDIDQYLCDFNITNEISAGSSLKFCRVAEGAADIYPRLGRTMEWDTAAGHGVLKFAGGEVKLLDGSPLKYGKSSFENPHFVAAGIDII